MNHSNRTFCVKVIETDSDLSELLANHKWPLCQAFEYNGFLYLNDGDAENKPEYIAFMIDRMEGTITIGRELGKIEPLGIELSQVKRSIQEFGQEHWENKFPLEVRVEPEWHHSCELCRFEEG